MCVCVFTFIGSFLIKYFILWWILIFLLVWGLRQSLHLLRIFVLQRLFFSPYLLCDILTNIHILQGLIYLKCHFIQFFATIPFNLHPCLLTDQYLYKIYKWRIKCNHIFIFYVVRHKNLFRSDNTLVSNIKGVKYEI